MSLGDALPENIKIESIQRQVTPGAVIKLNVQFDDGILKEKRFIVINVDNETVTLVINSQINRFIASKPELLKCQVLMKKDEHPCMDHDSYVDCNKERIFPFKDVLDQLKHKPEWILGEISESLRDSIIVALQQTNEISILNKSQYCESLRLK